MANVIEQDFAALPNASNPPVDYPDWLDPTGKAAARAAIPAGPRDDMFERAGFKAPAAAAKSTARDMFDDAGFAMPSSKPTAPKASTPSIADAKPGLDEKGKPGLFVEHPPGSGQHFQAVQRPAAGAPGQASGSPIAQALMAGDAPEALTQKDYAPIGPAKGPMLGAAVGAAGLGLAAPFIAPALGRGVLSTGKAAGTVGKLWLAEKALETLVPESMKPDIVKYIRALGEAH
jgi:hypothetical protein